VSRKAAVLQRRRAKRQRENKTQHAPPSCPTHASASRFPKFNAIPPEKRKERRERKLLREREA
jgi:hypothetical protein